MSTNPTTTVLANSLQGTETIIVNGEALNLADAVRSQVSVPRGINGEVVATAYTFANGVQVVTGGAGFGFMKWEAVTATIRPATSGIRRSND